MKTKAKSLSKINDYYGIFGLIVIIVGLIIFIPNFATYSNFYAIIVQGSILCVIAFGLTFPGIINEYDLSIGAIAGICSTLVCGLVFYFNLSIIPAIILSLVVATLIGTINAVLVIEFRILAIIATIGMTFILNAFELMINKGKRMATPEALVNIDTLSNQTPIPFYFILALFLLVILMVFSLYTKNGRYLYATGENKMAAKVAGVNTRLYGYLPFLFSAILGAIGGIMQITYTHTAQVFGGNRFLWDVLMAFFLGMAFFSGKKLFIGTFLGAFFSIIISQTLLLLNVDYYYRQLIRAIIIIMAIYVGIYSTNRKTRSEKS